MEEYQEIVNMCSVKQQELTQLKNICETINKEEDILHNKILSCHQDLKTLKFLNDDFLNIYKAIVKDKIN